MPAAMQPVMSKPVTSRGNGPSPATEPLTISRGVSIGPQRVVIYGPGGIGKSTLCATLAQVGIKPLFIDIENGSRFLDVARVEPATLNEARQIFHDDAMLKDFDAIVIDSLTTLEERTITWTLENIKHEKGHGVQSIEGYGYGKGYTHVYETFLLLLGDFDRIIRSGKHVICTAHDCTASVPNPAAEDWLRYEPRLQSPASGKGSIRLRVKEWCDHLLYIGYDTHVDKDGKASGSGTRAIYPVEQPTHLAKSRSLSDPIVFDQGDSEIWKLLFNTKEN